MRNGDMRGRLIHGDNTVILERLGDQGLEVACAYIDPPYNNRDRLHHYHDDMDDELWLDEITSVAGKIKDILSPAGSIWISIDDNMVHYLKVRLDEIFGRENFVTTIVWEHRTTRENRAVFSNNHEYILLYAKNLDDFKLRRNPLPFTSEWQSRFKNPDGDPRGLWQSVSATAQAGHATSEQFYELISPTGVRHLPPKGRCWVYSKPRMMEAIAEDRISFGRNGAGVPRIKKFLSEIKGGLTPHTLWKADEVGTTASAKKHILKLLQDASVFETPKPEELIARIISIASKPNEIVLDAYLGSGTTASVAHKLGRRYVGIEIGDHIATHCAARLRSVCMGEQGGISKEVGWHGGGEFEAEIFQTA